MNRHRNALYALLGSVLAMFISIQPARAQNLKQNIKGSLEHDVYISQLGDFHVQVPVHPETGGAVRDEYGKRGDMEMEQVIFTDDFGGFYRIISLKSSMSIDQVMNTFGDVREKQTLQTERGRELRVINVEKQGSEINVTSFRPGEPAQTTRPDLVTANLVFEKHGRIYHLAAGAVVLGDHRPEDMFDRARKSLDALLQTFELVELENKTSK